VLATLLFLEVLEPRVDGVAEGRHVLVDGLWVRRVPDRETGFVEQIVERP
jgi:hypothetical protein